MKMQKTTKHYLFFAINQIARATRPLLLLLFFFFSFAVTTHAFQTLQDEGVCGQDTDNAQECTPLSGNSGTTSPLFPDPGTKETRLPAGGERLPEATKTLPAGREVVVYFYWGTGCPHCEEEKRFLDLMKKEVPTLKVIDHEVWYNKENAALLARMAKAYQVKASGVPITFIGKDAFIGFSKHSRDEMAAHIRKCLVSECVNPAQALSGTLIIDDTVSPPTQDTSLKTEDLECTEKKKTVYIPLIGSLDTSEMSLPLITLVIAGLDSFNPCAFFVLFSLLGLLIHARSRFKMFLIGSEFVFFSGFIYFLFMTAWLNVFLLMGQVDTITKIAGGIAVVFAAINIKDFFLFKKGVSLTIPDSAKPKLFDRMRRLLKSTSILSIVIGTAVLAIAANSYELLCTAGFPMIYTRILTLRNLSPLSYYLYLGLYNIVYVVPLAIIVTVFTVTLGRRVLTDQQGRLLKLISGTMMLGLGGVLLLNPAVLNNAAVSFLLLLGTLAISATIALISKKYGAFH